MLNSDRLHTDPWVGRSPRRGFAVVWLIVWVPVLMILSALAIDVANSWLARVELENGLEAAALAAVKQWAETGDNLGARQVGVSYAGENAVRGNPIVIGTNYDDVTGDVNFNAECAITPGDPPKGNLIFGAIDESDPAYPMTFIANREPGCGGDGSVLLDVTGQGTAGLEADNAWGIAFIPGATTPPNLRIRTIIIDLRAGGGAGEFVTIPTLSRNAPGQGMVRDGSGGNAQADIEGFTDTSPTGQIQFFLESSGGSGNDRLRIEFTNDGTDDAGFEPCDRFRFGVRVNGVSSGNSHDDGDGIGQDAVGITVVFEEGPVGGPTTTYVRTGRYFNTTETGCLSTGRYFLSCNAPPGDLIVNEATTGAFPTGIPNLPCPASNAANNNGQSWTLLSAGGGGPYAVRAQATVEIPTLWQSLLGSCVGSHCITVRTTAMYDCQYGRPRLIKLDRYTCDDPTP